MTQLICKNCNAPINLTDDEARTMAGKIIGRFGGTSTSKIKQKAARANGKLGGRPRKSDDHIK